MVEDQQNIASFMIRFTQHIWRDAEDEPQVQWRGKINYVQGDEEMSFTDLASALEFIQRHLTQLTLDAAAGENESEQQKVLKKSYVLWEQFAKTYSNMFFESMQRALDQSDAMRDQIDQVFSKSLDSWQIPWEKPSSDISTAIDDLNVQLKKLAEKVSKLEANLMQD